VVVIGTEVAGVYKFIESRIPEVIAGVNTDHISVSFEHQQATEGMMTVECNIQ
jgi:hypothetical protein